MLSTEIEASENYVVTAGASYVRRKIHWAAYTQPECETMSFVASYKASDLRTHDTVPGSPAWQWSYSFRCKEGNLIPPIVAEPVEGAANPQIHEGDYVRINFGVFNFNALVERIHTGNFAGISLRVGNDTIKFRDSVNDAGKYEGLTVERAAVRRLTDEDVKVFRRFLYLRQPRDYSEVPLVNFFTKERVPGDLTGGYKVASHGSPHQTLFPLLPDWEAIGL